MLAFFRDTAGHRIVTRAEAGTPNALPAARYPTRLAEIVWAVGVLLALGACVGAERNAAFRATETQLFATRQAAALPCSTPAECDGAWRLARRYVEAHSSTRITRADADTIETAPPFLAGEVYLWASRTASGGGASVIRLKAMCKGMYDSDGGPGWQYDACAARILDIERGFRAYLNPAPVAPG